MTFKGKWYLSIKQVLLKIPPFVFLGVSSLFHRDTVKVNTLKIESLRYYSNGTRDVRQTKLLYCHAKRKHLLPQITQLTGKVHLHAVCQGTFKPHSQMIDVTNCSFQYFYGCHRAGFPHSGFLAANGPHTYPWLVQHHVLYLQHILQVFVPHSIRLFSKPLPTTKASGAWAGGERRDLTSLRSWTSQPFLPTIPTSSYLFLSLF